MRAYRYYLSELGIEKIGRDIQVAGIRKEKSLQEEGKTSGKLSGGGSEKNCIYNGKLMVASTQIFFLGMGVRSQTLTKKMTFLLPLPESWFQMSLLILSMFYFISGVSEFYGLITDLIPLFLFIWLKSDQSPTSGDGVLSSKTTALIAFIIPWVPPPSEKRYSNFLLKKVEEGLSPTVGCYSWHFECVCVWEKYLFGSLQKITDWRQYCQNAMPRQLVIGVCNSSFQTEG